MKHIFTGIFILGISAASPLHAFGFTPGSNWGGPTMNWGNAPGWNNGSAMNWGNVPSWNSPMMNWGNTPSWNTNPNMNWGNTQSWSPFNFGNNSWPTFTMPNINWQNQNMPGWNGYPAFTGNYPNNRVPAMIYQPVVPVRVLPPETSYPIPAPPQTSATNTAAGQSTAIPPIPVPAQSAINNVNIPAPENVTAPVPPAEVPAATVKAADETQKTVITGAGVQTGPVFPDPDDVPPEVKEIQE